MGELLFVLGLAAIPGVSNLVGSLGAEARAVSPRVLSAALHLAAGIVVAVVGLELMPRALATDPAWVPMLAFVAGGAVFLGIDALGHYLKARSVPRGGEQANAVAIYLGVALDLFSDGVMIGTGSVLNPSLGLLLALGQAPADLPEGFAAGATLRRAGVARRGRLLAAAGFLLPILGGAALGYLALRGAPEVVTLSVLALTGGALLAVVIEEMIPEAHDAGQSRWDSLYLTVGFVVFAAVSTYLG